MRLTWRDWMATSLVGAAVLLYALWLTGAEVFGISGAEAIAGTVLGLGLIASIVAVVYGVGADLLQASKVYLALTSLLGLIALVAGIVALVNGSEAMLAALVVATVLPWMASTARHSVIVRSPRARPGRTGAHEAGRHRPAA